MSTLSYAPAPIKVRDDLEAAHQRAWDRIARPGTWLDGARRVAIAAETRQALHCVLYQHRKEALSPFTIDGTHDSLPGLPDLIVEAVHRIVTDPGRLTEAWYRSLLDRGLTDTEYVETVGVVVTTVAVDTMAKGLGVPTPPLPKPLAGSPSQVRPAGAKLGPAWVPWIDPEDATGSEANLYGGRPSHVRRALSLVPDEVRGLYDLLENQYLSVEQLRILCANIAPSAVLRLNF